MADDTALVPIPDAPPGLLRQALTPADLGRAMTAYREMQAELDRAIPDAVVVRDGRTYRKKQYWRAVAFARRLTVTPTEERRDVLGTLPDGTDEVAWYVTYAATDGTVTCAGDGACTTSEKIGGRRVSQATEHNIRSHAHTRAYNRAVSNLAAFGEVSWDEIAAPDDDDRPAPPPARRSAPARQAIAAPGTPAVISDAQRKRLFAIGHDAGWNDAEIKTFLIAQGFASSSDVTTDRYDAIIKTLQAGVDGTKAGQP